MRGNMNFAGMVILTLSRLQDITLRPKSDVMIRVAILVFTCILLMLVSILVLVLAFALCRRVWYNKV
ncbi:hypothetical protein EYC84_002043 [Monilinia fructicola]|uniref:Uncharacterized protein n=1 Tax=Monilinia fructicola TaxID=38448 RepID=A0A5M9JZL0_MONFR|nr:hypothetical protein EYC84_002043 [Monilinia fructicola]